MAATEAEYLREAPRDHGDGTYHALNSLKALILADSGGSNGARVRMWKWALHHQLANPFGLTITVSHFPTGASKWNPIEHRLFSEISKHWAGQTLDSYQTIVDLIGSTTTQTGLRVSSQLIRKHYPTRCKVPNSDFRSLLLDLHEHLPRWNYTIFPSQNRN